MTKQTDRKVVLEESRVTKQTDKNIVLEESRVTKKEIDFSLLRQTSSYF